ncbi:uncharacterized protein LOC112568709 isoform X2 [Pomacea canaliculata]|uniref:uncharacterized protein LOC112568709 isoform X2 n=1 Tax=Pomacea canaliculata TaxID=400727 RepID=UPI000D736138|nr:uncharacterized protein LOC112568709 isoform X2 [Pomacea canaliculata]
MKMLLLAAVFIAGTFSSVNCQCDTGCLHGATNTCYAATKKVQLNNCASQVCQKKTTSTNTYTYSWKRTYNVSTDCQPSASPCDSNGARGCSYNGECKPLKTVIKVDNCLQYLCYNDASSPDPYWLERATGCYSPNGCMEFGDSYRDETKGVYRCELNFNTTGVKYARYVPPCTTPDGQVLGLRETVQVGQYKYSCTMTGLNTFDTLYQFPPQKQTCGPVYVKEPFYTPEGICSYQTYYCRLSCNYFESLCFDGEGNFKYLGDTFTNSNNQTCTCTADYNVNNYQYSQTKSLWNTPALCTNCKDGACVDPNDGSIHKWNELWLTNPAAPQLCTCHPLLQQAFCSDDITAVVNATAVLKVPVLP